jgi:hypothetical protein
MQGCFQTVSYFVGGRYIQMRVNKDVQVEENLSADRACSQLMPLMY